MYIKEISQVIPGYTFRGAIQQDNSGNSFVIQAKNVIRGMLYVDERLLTRIVNPSNGRVTSLQNGDVLLVARGMKAGAFRSTVFASDTQNVIASSSVHIIRVTRSHILPEYLSYYLNSAQGQYALSQIVSGSYIGAILRRRLENEIDIPVPPIQTQKTLVDLFENLQAQQHICEQKNEIHQQIINGLFRKVATI